jgi:membrane fusion protein (multidrug efflux system)
MKQTLAIILVMAFAGLAIAAGSPAFAQAVMTEQATGSAEPEPVHRKFPGRIEAAFRADVTAAVDGTILEIHFEPGQTVEKGDVLFTLDDTKYRLGVASAEAEVERATLNLQSLEEDLGRVEELKERGTASELQRVKAARLVFVARAILNQAEANLESERAKLANTIIRAPVSGIIGSYETSLGAQVLPGVTPRLTQIVQMDPIWVSYKFDYVESIKRLEIHSLRDLESLLEFVKLQIEISDGWVYEFSPIPTHGSAEVDPDTGEITIWAEVANPEHILRPGMRVTVISRNEFQAEEEAN